MSSDQVPSPESGTRELLLWLKTEFKDELPSAVIHSDEPNNKYKARKDWFVALKYSLEHCLDLGELKSPQIIKEVVDFIAYLRSDFASKLLTDTKDIERANTVINLVLNELGQK